MEHDYEPTQWSGAYKTGRQYPEEAPPIKRGTRLHSLLQQHRMIEILAVKHTKSLSVHCHSCEVAYTSTKTQQLEHHVASSKHLRRLAVPETATVPPKEHARRQLILENKRFKDFLQVINEDQLICKYCSVLVPYDSAKLNNHMHTYKHKSAESAATNRPFSIDLNDPERLKKLQAVVEAFPEEIALVDSFSKRLNDAFEADVQCRKAVSVNDIFCKVCLFKFDRTDPNRYRCAVKEHLRSKHHQAVQQRMAALKADQEEEGEEEEKILPALGPSKRIRPYRQIKPYARNSGF